MHWVIQENLHQERGHDDLMAALTRAGLSFSQHKVVPFSGDLIPDVSPAGPVIVMGTYSMCRTAKRKGWAPGCFDAGVIPLKDQMDRWHGYMLNSDATIGKFGDIAPTLDRFFVRPTADTKQFAGTVMGIDDFREWQRKVIALKLDDGSGLTADTEVFYAAPKNIGVEYRLWVVDGEIVTASRYPKASPDIDPGALALGRQMVEKWSPLPAFVLDVCLVDYGWAIV